MLGFKYLRILIDSGLVFLFIYALTFVGLPIPLSKVVLAIVILLVNKRLLFQEILNNRMLKYSFWVWAIFTIHFMFLIIIKNNDTSISFIRSILWIFGECILGSYIVFFYLKSKYSIKTVLRIVFGVVTLQSFFVLLSFISPSLRDFINSILNITDERGLSNYRMKGLSNFGGASLSYLQMIGVVYGGILLLLFNNTVKQKSFLSFGMFFIMLMQIFIGRTGLIASILIIVVIYFQQAINNKSFFKLIFQNFAAIILVFLLFNIVVNLIPPELQSSFNDKVIARSVELYDNFEESGELKTTSTEDLSTMYFLPNTDSGILFGEALWDDNAGIRTYYGRLVDSDVGYVRLIFAVGAIVGLVFYSLYLFFIYDLWKIKYLKAIRLVLITLLIIFILGEFKEPFLVRPSGIIKSLFLLYFLLSNKNQNNNVSNTLSF